MNNVYEWCPHCDTETALPPIETATIDEFHCSGCGRFLEPDAQKEEPYPPVRELIPLTFHQYTKLKLKNVCDREIQKLYQLDDESYNDRLISFGVMYQSDGREVIYPWTRSDIELRKQLRKERRNAKQIAVIVGHTVESVERKLNELNL